MSHFLLAVLTLLLAISPVLAQQVKPGMPASPGAAVALAPPPTLPDELECQVLTGRVTDEFAYPLTGATIMLRNPGKGFSPDAYITNSEGHYIISSKQPIPRNTVMEISAAGYNMLELPLTNCRPLDLTLIPLVSNHSKVKIRTKKPSGSGKMR